MSKPFTFIFTITNRITAVVTSAATKGKIRVQKAAA
jgi:hypothetical protein